MIETYQQETSVRRRYLLSLVATALVFMLGVIVASCNASNVLGWSLLLVCLLLVALERVVTNSMNLSEIEEAVESGEAIPSHLKTLRKAMSPLSVQTTPAFFGFLQAIRTAGTTFTVLWGLFIIYFQMVGMTPL